MLIYLYFIACLGLLGSLFVTAKSDANFLGKIPFVIGLACNIFAIVAVMYGYWLYLQIFFIFCSIVTVLGFLIFKENQNANLFSSGLYILAAIFSFILG